MTVLQHPTAARALEPHAEASQSLASAPATPEEIQAARDYGYRVHTARGDEFDSDLAGRWWWTLTKPGWVDIVTDPDDHASEADAWAAAVAHHKAEQTLDAREPA
jgi:hypothetical protein